MMVAQNGSKRYCTACCVTKHDLQTCPQQHYCNDYQIFTSQAVKNRMKCSMCISCPVCLGKLGTKDITESGVQLFFYACGNCGYNTRNFDYLVFKKDDPRDKEDYNKLLKKKVADSLKMNDFDSYFRYTLDSFYSKVKQQVEFSNEAEKVRTNNSSYFKIDKIPGNTNFSNKKLNQNSSIVLSDFGILETDSKENKGIVCDSDSNSIADASKEKDRDSEKTDVVWDSNVLDSYYKGMQQLDQQEYMECKNKNNFDLADFSNHSLQAVSSAPNALIHTAKYLMPIKPHYDVFIIKHENPVDGSILSCNNDDKAQKFYKNTPYIRIQSVKQRVADNFDVLVKFKSHSSDSSITFEMAPISPEEFNYSRSVEDPMFMNAQFSFVNSRKVNFKIPKTGKDNFLQHNLSLDAFVESDKASSIVKRQFNYVILKGTVAHLNNNDNLLFGLRVNWSNNGIKSDLDIILEHKFDVGKKI